MPEPVGCFIEYESVAALAGCPDEGLLVRGVRYRKRPPDTGCLHPRVTFGTPHRGMVDVVCECGHEWKQVKVIEVAARKERG